MRTWGYWSVDAAIMRLNGWKLGRVALTARAGLIGLSQNLHVPIPMALFQRGANWTVDSKHWALLECEEIRTRGLSGLVGEPDAPHRW